MKLIATILTVGAIFSIIYLLQLSTFQMGTRHYLPDPTISTRYQLAESPVFTIDNRNESTPTSDQCLPRNNLTDEAAGAKLLEKRLPECLIIGFAKCGTYALKSFLTLHPDIVGPNQEVAFFTGYYHRGYDWYRSQMPLSLESQITIEKTPSYILSLQALWRIRKFNASIKLIVSVRDPLIRLQSSYAHAQAAHEAFNETFESWLLNEDNIIRAADYATHIKNVFRLFQSSQVLIVQEEELEKTPLAVLRKVETFLGLCHAFENDLLVFNSEKGFFCFNQTSRRYQELEHTLTLNHKTGCFTRSKGRTHPQIDRLTMKRIVLKMSSYNEQLFALTGIRFNWTHPGSF
ncbi:unnamed protein product [Candidula unifasciata]|uniref:Sulfotransferase domain-containing protein n=1 Tax=Candidula unifasciata TaxID=100452 RepID=A0A8S3YND9_9EUPU|nr:unnamed protein product [Candidula unifasciata]